MAEAPPFFVLSKQGDSFWLSKRRKDGLLLRKSIHDEQGVYRLTLEMELRRRTLIVRLTGELDHHTADLLRSTVEAELDKEVASSVLLSLSGLSFMDSSGLGVILGRYRRLNQMGGKMAACCLNPQVQRIFELSGLTRVISVYDTEEAALSQLWEGAR